MDQKVDIAGIKSGKPSGGSAGLYSQCMGLATTVSSVAFATGGIKSGNLIRISNNK